MSARELHGASVIIENPFSNKPKSKFRNVYVFLAELGATLALANYCQTLGFADKRIVSFANAEIVVKIYRAHDCVKRRHSSGRAGCDTGCGELLPNLVFRRRQHCQLLEL